MPTLPLPHTPGCLVCGPLNPHGLRLDLAVDADTGVVRVRFVPQPHHIGFEGVLHGGVLATVLDEAMVWAASWTGKRFCLCGELAVRFRNAGAPGVPLLCEARVDSARSRLLTTSAVAKTEEGVLVAEATGKYVPLPPEQNRAFMKTFIDDPSTHTAAELLRQGAA